MAPRLHIAPAAGKRPAWARLRFLGVFLLGLVMASCAQTTSTGPRVSQPIRQDTPEALTDDTPQITDEIRIAAVLPLTGPEARLGDAMAKAIELAFFEAQDPRITLQFFDSAGSNAAPETRSFLVQDLVAFNPAAVIGPLFSQNAQALAPVLLDRAVPVLSFSNDLAANAAGAILLGQQPEQEIARVLAYVAGQLETRRIGMIVPDDVYGTRVTTAATATLAALNEQVQVSYDAEVLAYEQTQQARIFAGFGPSAPDILVLPAPEDVTEASSLLEDGMEDALVEEEPEEDSAPEPLRLYDVTVTERYERSLRTLDIPARRVAQFYRREAEVAAERDFLTELDEPIGLDYLDYIRNLDTFGPPTYDALIIAEGGQMLRALAPLMTVYEVDEEEIQFIGTGLWNDPGLSREPALHGGLFATSAPVGDSGFADLYAASYGEGAPPLAGVAYDAMAILALAMRDETGA
ncbi:MAG: penicillin-binding protein activator, partial [Pseudomonadota bacterium]